jgi:hypothetical protein
VIDSYVKSLQESRERNYEESELVLYKNLIIEKTGKLDETLAHLDVSCKPHKPTLSPHVPTWSTGCIFTGQIS